MASRQGEGVLEINGAFLIENPPLLCFFPASYR